MASFVSDTPVSGPLYVPHAKPDVDLNGIGWSYQYGMVFGAADDDVPIKPPVGYAL